MFRFKVPILVLICGNILLFGNTIIPWQQNSSNDDRSSLSCSVATAFALHGKPSLITSRHSSSSTTTDTATTTTPTSSWTGGTSRTRTSITRLRAGGGNGFDNNDDDDDDVGMGKNAAENISELTSALARLDKQWQIQLKARKTPSRWTKLVLPDEENNDGYDEKDKEIPMEEQTPGIFSSNNDDTDDESKDYVWMLEPPNNVIPSCIIVFIGGAGLGQFPHIAYNELLKRISDKLNAVCIAAPYQVGLDHFSIAKRTGEKIRRALIYCEDEPSISYPSSIPTYCLGHSLGCKLQTIYIGATGQTFDGIGFMSFNNFSFGQTIGMVRMFAEQLRDINDTTTNKSRKGRQVATDDDDDYNNNNNKKSNDGTSEFLNTIFSFAENIVDMIGVDFTPNAKDTERLIQLKYDDLLQDKTRLFVFDEDNLDNSKEFIDNCSGGGGDGNGNGITASGLPGGHLAPVYFKFSLQDLEFDTENGDGGGNNEVPSEVYEMASEAMMGGFQSASFGDEEVLDSLVGEIYDWILGKVPSRTPQWDSTARNIPPPKFLPP